MSNVFIKHERYSKLLPMDNFDYSHHRDVHLYVSEYLNVKMKSAQNLKNTYFVENALYPHCRSFT